MKRPRVSIGLPVYNGAETVGRAIKSLLAQRMGDFELFVSDNASTDRTGSIVKALATSDSRVLYIRQPTNMGAMANFKFVLDQASSDYFMWAAADDSWDPEFIEANLFYLERHPEYVASISRVRIGDLDPDKFRTQGTFPLNGNVRENLLAYVLNPDANSRFYAIHRIHALRSAWQDDLFWACDWALVCRILHFGKYHEEPRVLMWRDHGGASRNIYKTIRAWGLGRRDTWLPMWTYSRHVLRNSVIYQSPRAIIWLTWLNVNTARKMLLGWVREFLAFK
jgi:glycosyltransferase involved in cell wall biosynthesis